MYTSENLIYIARNCGSEIHGAAILAIALSAKSHSKSETTRILFEIKRLAERDAFRRIAKPHIARIRSALNLTDNPGRQGGEQ